MEEVLEVYQRPFDEKRRWICLDESPKQLIAQVRKSFQDSKGVIYEDFEYRREAVVDLYLICEPLVGSRAQICGGESQSFNLGGNYSTDCAGKVSRSGENNHRPRQFMSP